MVTNGKLLNYIANCTKAGELINIMANAAGKADEVARAAFLRLITVQPKEAPGSLEHDLWRSIYAFEHLLSDERGKTTRLARTRQKVARDGEAATLNAWALSNKETEGFRMLMEREMPELTGEAIILRHPDRFPREIVGMARHRLV